jgi:hypothetical protein
MKLYIWTQDQENYGDETNPHWKMKGGTDYFIPNFKGNDTEVTIAIMGVRNQIEEDNPFFRSNIMGWKIVKDDYLTELEKYQLEYEGGITFKTREIIW